MLTYNILIDDASAMSAMETRMFPLLDRACRTNDWVQSTYKLADITERVSQIKFISVSSHQAAHYKAQVIIQ